MRDPKRIPKVLRLIKKYWTKCPDLRLSQLIGNLSNRHDPYYFEDDELIVILNKLLAGDK